MDEVKATILIINRCFEKGVTHQATLNRTDFIGDSLFKLSTQIGMKSKIGAIDHRALVMTCLSCIFTSTS